MRSLVSDHEQLLVVHRDGSIFLKYAQSAGGEK